MPPVILFLGRISVEKGVDDLLYAFSRLVRAHPDVCLVCAGDGDLQRVTQLATKLGIADAVKWSGWVGKEEKDQLLASAAIFVLPSHVEAMPMSLLEAMAAGVPVVATRVGSVPEVVTDGVNGILVAPGDVEGLVSGISRLLANVEERNRFGTAAKVHVLREFSIEFSMAKMVQLLNQAGVCELVNC